MCNATVWVVRVTIVAVEKEYVSNMMSVWFLAFFCAVLYCHLWPVWLYHIFAHYLINGTIFEKKVIEKKCILIFSTTFV
jgi:hypothetical protein